MKTWKRLGYESKDGTLYIGSEEDLIDLQSLCKDENHKLRIMRETDFKKMKRVYDAAMKWDEQPNEEGTLRDQAIQGLWKACEKARTSRKVKNKRP